MNRMDHNPRTSLWIAMADHFLDTETRTQIPATALVCVRAGFSVQEARNIWRYEVTPALYMNTWSVAGEWACWDTAWLLDTIAKHKISRRRIFDAAIYRLRANVVHGDWLCIERCMTLLLTLPSPEEQTQTTEALTYLARLHFDFMYAFLEPSESVKRRARTLYPTVFCELMKSCLGGATVNENVNKMLT